MASSATIIAALKHEGGAIIAADSQASDMVAGVRWPVEKLDRVGTYPFVLGFSGSMGSAERARASLSSSSIHQGHFRSKDKLQKLTDACFDPIYTRIKKINPVGQPQVWEVALWGLGAFWAGDKSHIIEFETSGDSCFHDYFHAIGSGAQTAYAIWRTLGGRGLEGLPERKSLHVILRVLRTCVNVEVWGVDEPLAVWMVDSQGARKLPKDEVEAELQYVSEWEERDRRAFFNP